MILRIKKSLLLYMFFSVGVLSTPIYPMGIPIIDALVGALVRTAVSSAVPTAAAVGKYIENHYIDSHIVNDNLGQDLMGGYPISLPTQSYQNLQLVQQAYPQQVFNQALQPDAIYNLGARSAASSAVFPNNQVLGGANSLATNYLTASHVQVLSPALNADKTTFSLQSNPYLARDISIPIDNTPSPISVSFEVKPGCTLSPAQNAALASAQQIRDNYLAAVRDPTIREQIALHNEKVFNVVITSLKGADNALAVEAIEAQRSLGSQIAPAGSLIQQIWQEKVWGKLNSLLYDKDGVFKGLSNAAEIEKATLIVDPYFKAFEMDYENIVKNNLNTPGFSILSERIQGTNSWGDWFKQLGTSIARQFSGGKTGFPNTLNHPFNADFDAAIALCNKGDLNAAKTIMDKYIQGTSLYTPRRFELLKTVLDVAYNKRFNEHNILREHTRSPLWDIIKTELDAKLNTSEYVLSHKEAVQVLAQHYALASDIIRNFHSHISTAPVELRNFAFELALFDKSEWLKIANIQFERNQNLQQFTYSIFNANGLMKGLGAEKSAISQYPMTTAINQLENIPARTLFNHFALLDLSRPLIKEQALKALDALKQSCQISSPVIQQAALHYAESIYHALTHAGADQRIFDFDVKVGSLKQSVHPVYEHIIMQAADAARTLQKLEGKKDLMSAVDRAHATLNLQVADHAAQALREGMLDYANQILDKGVPWSRESLRTIVENLGGHLPDSSAVAMNAGLVYAMANSMAGNVGCTSRTEQDSVIVEKEKKEDKKGAGLSPLSVKEKKVLAGAAVKHVHAQEKGDITTSPVPLSQSIFALADGQIPKQSPKFPMPPETPNSSSEDPDNKKGKSESEKSLTAQELNTLQDFIVRNKARLIQDGFSTEKLKKIIEYARSVEGSTEAIRGFIEAVKNMDPGATSSAVGRWYELEGVMMAARRGEQVIALNRTYKIPGMVTREIDIVTEKSFIECKAITWSKLSQQKLDDTFSRMVEQLALAKHQGKDFSVYSRNSIPTYLKEKLLERGIKIVEGGL